MSEFKVVYIGTLNGRFEESLVGSVPKGFSLELLTREADVGEMCKELENADFLVLGTRIPDEVYRAGKRLKFIPGMAAGYDFIPLALLHQMGVPVANMAGVHSITVAEHAVTLMLMVLRRVIPSLEALRDGKWRGDIDEGLYAELYQKTVGIVGLGNVGRWVGKIVSGFGAQVVFYNRSKVSQTIAGLIPARPVTLEELLRISDIVSLSVALNQDTQGMIGRDELRLMKSTSILINTCRGKVVDEAALIEALQQHRIAGAGLDTFEKEPIDLNSPLLQMAQVVCTPHIAGFGWENVERRLNRIWGNFEVVLRGERPFGLISTD